MYIESEVFEKQVYLTVKKRNASRKVKFGLN